MGASFRLLIARKFGKTTQRLRRSSQPQLRKKTADPYDSVACRQEGQDDSWLAGVRYSPDRPAVCFQFARDGRCDRLETVSYTHLTLPTNREV